MPQFSVEISANGRVERVWRDGVPDFGGVRLEQLFSVVTIYFALAGDNLRLLRETREDQRRRGYGLQAFLMSLTGLEAFTNVYFRLRGEELRSAPILNLIEQPHGSLSRKLEMLVGLTEDPPINNQAQLIRRVSELSQLRNELVHPRWQPSSILVGGSYTEGLVENRQALFENEQLCRETLFWCLLVIARIAEARELDVSAFLFRWTGNYGLSMAQILSELGDSSTQDQSAAMEEGGSGARI